MYTLTTLIAILGGVLYLAYWVKDVSREVAIKKELARQECKKVGHDIFRVNAFGDPRWPVDRCRRCDYQHDVKYQCPHCGEEIKMKGL